ncbi:MAG TPA: hypothetical protein VKS21_07185, partial [Spirochaetota bacterium]|nr:hypothetical protein [Spirochaetota bacterium]
NWLSVSGAFRKPLDLSRAKSVSLAVKANGSGGLLNISLEDGAGVKLEHKDAFILNSTGWHEIVVPLADTLLNKKNIVTMNISVSMGNIHDSDDLKAGLRDDPNNVTMGKTVKGPNSAVLPKNDYIFIDEITYGGKSSALDSGKSKVNISGSASVQFSARSGSASPTHMRNRGTLGFAYEKKKYILTADLKLGEAPITAYNPPDWQWLYFEREEFTYYSTKQWEWQIDQILKSGHVGLKLLDLNPLLREVNLGTFRLNYHKLVFRSLWNATGIQLIGDIRPGAYYHFNYLKYEGDGYGLLGYVHGRIPSLRLAVAASFLYQNRKGKMIKQNPDKLFNSQTYQEAKIGTFEFSWHSTDRNYTNIFSRDTDRNKKEDEASARSSRSAGSGSSRVYGLNFDLEGAVTYSEQNWYGKVNPATEYPLRTLIYEGKTSNSAAENSSGIGGYVDFKTTLLISGGLSLSERLQYRYIAPGFMGGPH